MSTKKITCIYHGANCLDGFGSAWACWRYFSSKNDHEVEYLSALHDEPFPNVTGHTVYLVDFAYKRATMAELCRNAKRVIVLDHHQSAQEGLEGLDKEFDNLDLHFDMTRSGAVISWQYFHSEPAPLLLQYVQDRDLWTFELPNSRDVTAAMMSYSLEFERWNEWAQSESAIADLAIEGRTINRYRHQLVNYYKTRSTIMNIAGFEVPVVNAPNAIVSELLNELSNGYPFAASYSDVGTQRGWSLRSRPDGENVARIAAQFGGGGHPRAAGFVSRCVGAEP